MNKNDEVGKQNMKLIEIKLKQKESSFKDKFNKYIKSVIKIIKK